MPRQQDLARFYKLMERLECNIGERRMLGECNGRMNWPGSGVYFFFENGEMRTGSGRGDRIVRVGSHALNSGETTSLWGRLRKHRGARTPRRPQTNSVFRKWIGNALCRQNYDDNAPPWPGLRRELSHDQEMEVEGWINDHMWPMTLLFLPVRGRRLRAYIESNAIALLSEFGEENPVDPPSEEWLGWYCDSDEVRESGLWQVEDVDCNPQADFLDELETHVNRAGDYS